MNSKQVIILLAAAAACVDFANGRQHSKHTFQPIQSPIHFDSTTENDSYSNNLTVKFSTIPMLGINQTFPTVNTTRLDLNEDYVTIPTSDSGTLIPQNTAVGAVEERTTTKNYNELDDEIVVRPVNATTIADIDQYGKFREELRQDILHQFDIISADLQELVKLFRTNENNNKFLKEKSNHTMLQRLTRSLPVDDSPVCEVELITLTDLRDDVKTTLEKINSAGNNNCPLNYDANTCEELVNLLLCGYNHLKNGFIKATRNSNVAIDEATMWENILKEYEEKSTKLLDDTKTSLSQTYNQRIDTFKRDMQVLQKKANFYLKTIWADGADVCAYRITNGNIHGALEKFIQLRDEFEMLEEVIIQSIISTVYKLELIDNIISFIKKLPYCRQDEIAYPALFDEMHKNNHLTNPVVLIVSDAVKQCMQDSSLDNKFTSYARKMLSPRISFIEKAYSNSLDNVENVVKYIGSLTYSLDKIIGLSTLYESMKNNNDLDSYQLLMLAYKVKDVTIQPDYYTVPQYYKDKLTTIKDSLPPSVRVLVWNGKRCTIRNRKRWEYLYSPLSAYDIYSRYIFTRMTGDIYPESYWDFKPHDGAKFFHIKNSYKEYLYASNIIPKSLEYEFFYSSDVEHSGRRYVFTWMEENKEPTIEGLWQLTPVNNGGYFKIRNKHWNEYLYADGQKIYHPNKRYVFTWTFGALEGVMKEEGEWIIDC